ncbi:unnamed protein product [Absidia cylindrospora]
MSKRHCTTEDSDLVNVLRQRQKNDPQQKQLQGQQTFALMMRASARQHLPRPSTPLPNSYQQKVLLDCFRCPLPKPSYCLCTFCEHSICQQCIQRCQRCDSMYCTACSVIDYSASIEQVFCLTCLTC